MTGFGNQFGYPSKEVIDAWLKKEAARKAAKEKLAETTTAISSLPGKEKK